jgi:ATP-binding cassette subfamily B protein
MRAMNTGKKTSAAMPGRKGPTTLSAFISFYKPHRRLFAADMFCALMIAGIEMVFPVATKWSIEHLLPQHKYGFFFALIAGLFALYILRTLFSYFVTYWGHTVGAYIEADMRKSIFNHIQKLSFSFFDSQRTGQLMSRVTTDLFDVTELAHHGPEDLFIAILTITGSFLIILSFQPWMALVLIVFLPLMIGHVLRCRRGLMRASRAVKQKTGEILSALESSISGVRVASAFTNEAYESQKFD